MTTSFLSQSIQYLKGIGPRRATVLSEAGVVTHRDLLQYYPRRYLDRTTVTPVRGLRSDQDSATVVGVVQTFAVVPGRRGRRFELELEDADGSRMRCVWFHAVSWVSKAFETGDRVAFHGKPQRYGGRISMVHPDFDKLDEDAPALDTGRIIALYPGSAPLATVGLTSRSFRRILYTVFKDHGTRIPEVLPARIRREHGLMEGRVALRAIHFPRSNDELKEAARRLKFEELFFIQLMLGISRLGRVAVEGPSFGRPGERATKLLSDVIPFELTGDQRRALGEISADLQSGHQMNRLLQGDVGSGKTVVAAAAIAHSADCGFQSAFMAPTEILAEQHLNNLQSYLNPLGMRIRLLVGKQRKEEREEILKEIAAGETDVVVGTHALIQDAVTFSRLGLAVVDEQHRFGVMQRAEMVSKGQNPHILLMTATPIPRSLAMTLYGDLDVSLIRERPPGRTAVQTRLYGEKQRAEMYRFVDARLRAGAQAYVVFPLVEESEKLDLRDAQSGADALRGQCPDASVDLIHGRMASDEKTAIMARFKEGATDILVATTVIEVGVDVPNASLMIIEHAERFGLSQLHQLRGRVGRGSERSYCLLMADYARSAEARTRLEAMVRTDDGFEISEIDLKLRGAGDFFGTRQSGLPDLRIADLVQDTGILAESRDAARGVLEADPKLASAHNRTMAQYFDAFYSRSVMRLGRVG